MLSEKVRDTAADEARILALQAMGQAALKESPAAWVEAVSLTLGEPGLLTEAIATARRLRPAKPQAVKLGVALLIVANDEKKPAALRVGALAAVPGGLAKVEPGHFTLLRANLGGDQPVAVRSAAAEVLARAKLSSAQLLALTETLKTAGPWKSNGCSRRVGLRRRGRRPAPLRLADSTPRQPAPMP